MKKCFGLRNVFGLKKRATHELEKKKKRGIETVNIKKWKEKKEALN